MTKRLEQTLASGRACAVQMIRVLDFIKPHIPLYFLQRHTSAYVLFVRDYDYRNFLHIFKVQQGVELIARQIDSLTVRRVYHIEKTFAIFNIKFPNPSQLILTTDIPKNIIRSINK